MIHEPPELRPTMTDYRPFQEAAERIAIEAGDFLREAYGRVAVREKGPGDLVTEADHASQRLIAGRLAEAFPDHTLLAEEDGVTPDPDRPFRWIVDPIDGTVNFAHGFPLWCVSIALEHAGELVVGVIHAPLTRSLYSASKGRGATLDGRPMRVSSATTLHDSLITTGFPTRFEPDAPRLLSLFNRFSTGTHSVRRTGTTAMNLAFVASGACELCYATSVNSWDVAAGVVLIREAGGLVTGLNGEPYDVYGSEILASNGKVHDEAIAAAAEAAPVVVTPPSG